MNVTFTAVVELKYWNAFRLINDIYIEREFVNINIILTFEWIYYIILKIFYL